MEKFVELCLFMLFLFFILQGQSSEFMYKEKNLIFSSADITRKGCGYFFYINTS